LAEFIVNTSPVQYLHMLGQLELLPALADRVLIPPAVLQELTVGRSVGLDLPSLTQYVWMAVVAPADTAAIKRVARLGAGETEVLALARETPDALAILDDRLARRAAAVLGVPLRGTLGLLLDAKARGLVAAVGPLLSQLRSCGFRLSVETAHEFLERAGETP
jgi:uncharacterized protein